MKSIANLFSTLCAVLCASLILTACGGGGGGGSSTTSNGNGTGTTPPPAAQASATLSASAASVTAGQNVTLTWSSQNTGASGCQASGAWTGQLAASGSQQVATSASASAYTATYTITCGAASASAAVSVTPPGVQNTMPIVLDGGPAGARGAINIPFVSVTVCRPGTSVCQTIDHVMVDTGSFGLRLIAPLDDALALPAVQTPSGAPAGECSKFVSGYTWGSVLQADIKLAGEVAAGQSIQVIGAAPGGIAAPSSCTNAGGNIGTVSALGANGVLGVGLFKQDCGQACVNTAISATYYACSSGSCTPSSMPLAQQVSNPVAAFASDNNGLSISLPAVGTGGSSGTLTGTLTFGIGTQSNNGLEGATRYVANSSGHIRTVYKSSTLSGSFIDSGSNGIFFNDTALTKCTLSKDFYCPPTPVSLSATITAYDGSATATIPFTIESVDALPDTVVAGWIGGPSGTSASSSNAFDWGLPFFFGRRVFVGLESDTASPYWAF